MIIEELYIYPIKSTHRVTQTHAEVKPWGLAGDRRWMIVDDEAGFLTQRTIPRMSLIQAVPQPGDKFMLAAFGQESIFVDVPGETAPSLRVSIWRDSVSARVASDQVNMWLSTFLGRTVRLVHMHDPSSRLADPTYAKPGTTVSFVDGYPLLCTTKASLLDLNSKLSTPIPMGRFRPNVVVSGDRPFGEDNWKRIRMGGIIFSVVKPCTRCSITTVDQNTALRGKEPLRTLSSFRERGGKVYFGENLVPENTGVIQRGDRVEVLEYD